MLSRPSWLVTYRDGIPIRRRTVTHPGSNRARRALTSFIQSAFTLPSSRPLPAAQIRSHDFWRYVNLCVCRLLLFFLYYAIYGSTQAHKYKKAKIHLKYDLKYKKDINTNIKAHNSAR